MILHSNVIFDKKQYFTEMLFLVKKIIKNPFFKKKSKGLVQNHLCA